MLCTRRYSLMAFVETRYEHVVLDDQGVPRISGTTMKITELVTAQTAYGWSPEELDFQFPYLSLGQIHSALAYYRDHQDELGPRYRTAPCACGPVTAATTAGNAGIAGTPACPTQ